MAVDLLADINEGALLRPTVLGTAAFKSGIDTTLVHLVHDQMADANRRLHLDTDLHLLFLLTPLDLVRSIQPDWMQLYRRVCDLTDADKLLAEDLGCGESYLGAVYYDSLL